ncbi:PEP-CTERM sorting domain-containing protein [Candidatus Auribacterota bacterium]
MYNKHGCKVKEACTFLRFRLVFVLIVLILPVVFCANSTYAYEWYTEEFFPSGGGYGCNEIGVNADNEPTIAHIYYDDPTYYVAYNVGSGGSWNSEQIFSSSNIVNDISMYMDGETPYIVFKQNTGGYAGMLKYKDGVSWETTTFNSGYMNNSTVIVDDSDKVHIAYRKNDTSELRYACYDTVSTSWISVNEVIDSGSGMGQYVSIGVIGSDPVIAYYTGNTGTAELKYRTKSGSSWNDAEVVASAGDTDGQYCTLAIDSADRPYIVYVSTGVTGTGLSWAIKDGGSWDVQTVVDVEPGFTDMVLVNDKPRIVYSSGGSKYIEYNGTTWSTPEVTGARADPRLAYTTDGAVYITSIKYDGAPNEIMFTVGPTPEPSTIISLIFGIAALGVLRYKRKKCSK